MTRRTRTRLAAAAVAPLLALSLVACGDDADDADDRDDAAATSAPATSAPATSGAPATSETPATSDAPASGSAAPSAGGDVLLTASATAAGAVPDGTVLSVDRRDTGDWEVSLVTPDGTEQDVAVSADGATVTSGPVEDTDHGDDAGEAERDRDERLRLLDAPVDLEAAVAASAGSAGSGELSSAELDEDNGVATWEVQYGEDTPDELTVEVDATTGEVLRTERDD